MLHSFSSAALHGPTCSGWQPLILGIAKSLNLQIAKELILTDLLIARCCHTILLDSNNPGRQTVLWLGNASSCKKTGHCQSDPAKRAEKLPQTFVCKGKQMPGAKKQICKKNVSVKKQWPLLSCLMITKGQTKPTCRVNFAVFQAIENSQSNASMMRARSGPARALFLISYSCTQKLERVFQGV